MSSGISMSYNGLPQDDWNKPNYSLKPLTSKGPRTQAAVQKSSENGCNWCNIFLLTIFIVAISIAITLPLTLSDRFRSGIPTESTVTQTQSQDSLDEGASTLVIENKDVKEKDKKEVTDAVDFTNEDNDLKLDGQNQTYSTEASNVTAIPFDDDDNEDDNDDDVIANTEEPARAPITEVSSSPKLQKEKDEAIKNLTLFSNIIGEIFKEEHPTEKNLTQEDFKAWMKKLALRPSVEIAVLGTIALFMGLLLLIISIICCMQRNASKSRIIRIKEVVTDLQAPDKVILLTSDISEEEET